MLVEFCVPLPTGWGGKADTGLLNERAWQRISGKRESRERGMGMDLHATAGEVVHEYVWEMRGSAGHCVHIPFIPRGRLPCYVARHNDR